MSSTLARASLCELRVDPDQFVGPERRILGCNRLRGGDLPLLSAR
jgi:hypothetical protein